MVILLGITEGDTEEDINYLIEKIVNMRLFGTEEKSFQNFTSNPCISIQFHDHKEVLNPLYQTLKKLYEGKVQIIFMKDVGYKQKGITAELFWLEINSIKAGKANMMRHLSKIVGCSLKDFIVFGDNYNDIDMLELARLPIVMDNAPDSVKLHAQEFIDSNEKHGVINYLIKHKEKIIKK